MQIRTVFSRKYSLADNGNAGAAHFLRLLVTTSLVAVALSACGKTQTPMSTADRVKIVEEKQKSDPNFYLEKKAADASAGKPASKATPSTPPVTGTAQAEQANTSQKM